MKHTFRSIACLVAFIWLVFSAQGKAAQAGVYAVNDLLMFFQNPEQTGGTSGTASVVYFNLGSTFNVFRDAATPSSGAFGSTIYLGNINSILTSSYGSDWTDLSSSIFFGANGQNGSTSSVNTSTSNGDFARTVYITKPRTSVGSVGQANSVSPLYAPSQTAVAGQIAGANAISGMTQPGVVAVGDTLLDGYNPFFNGAPANAYSEVIPGGLMNNISSTRTSLGSISNVVGALDLYRVAKTSGTGTSSASIWQNSNNITATYSNNFGVAGGGSAAAFYLGTITLSSDGAVNFVAAGGSSVSDYTAWAAEYPDADLTDKEGDYDKDGFKNVDEYAFGTNPTLGNTALSSATVVSNNLTVGFFRRSTANDQAPAYAVFSITDFGNAFTNNGASISILTNVAPAGYQAASVTQPVSGSKIFYRIKATLPQEN